MPTMGIKIAARKAPTGRTSLADALTPSAYYNVP